MKKFSLSDAKNFLKERNLIMLNEEEFKNKESKINVIDKEGYKYLTSISCLLANDKVMVKFSSINPHTIYNIKLYLKINGFKNKLVSNEYINFSKSLIFTCCDCGKEYKVTFDHFREGQIRCKECAKIYGLKGRKNKEEDIINFFKSKGLALLEEYTRNNKRMTVMDEYGYKGKISYNSLKTSNKILYFSIYNPYTIENIKHYITTNNINVELLSDEYKGKDEKLLFRCECGETFETTFGAFKQLNKFRCDKCSKKQSRLSYLTEKYLKEKGIEYIKEYKIDDCINKRQLPFDFAIFVNGNMKLIECDGIQHFKVTKFNGCNEAKAAESYNITSENDRIKNEYCKNNNIELIRIPYYEFDNGNYKNILNKLCV